MFSQFSQYPTFELFVKSDEKNLGKHLEFAEQNVENLRNLRTWEIPSTALQVYCIIALQVSCIPVWRVPVTQ